MTEEEELKLSVQIQASSVSVSGKNLSDNVIDLLLSDLQGYSYQQISDALRRVRLESSFFNTKEIVSRIDDGRPDAEEAWGMIPKSEAESVVWSTEMQTAYAAALPMIEARDRVAARMAFVETYRTESSKSRAQGLQVKWTATLGEDHTGRERALAVAVEAGRISRAYAINLLPSSTFKVHEGGKHLLEASRSVGSHHLLEAPEEEKPSKQVLDKMAALSGALDDRKKYTGGRTFQKPTDKDIAALEAQN